MLFHFCLQVPILEPLLYWIILKAWLQKGEGGGKYGYYGKKQKGTGGWVKITKNDEKKKGNTLAMKLGIHSQNSKMPNLFFPIQFFLLYCKKYTKCQKPRSNGKKKGFLYIYFFYNIILLIFFDTSRKFSNQINMES